MVIILKKFHQTNFSLKNLITFIIIRLKNFLLKIPKIIFSVQQEIMQILITIWKLFWNQKNYIIQVKKVLFILVHWHGLQLSRVQGTDYNRAEKRHRLQIGASYCELAAGKSAPSKTEVLFIIENSYWLN